MTEAIGTIAIGLLVFAASRMGAIGATRGTSDPWHWVWFVVALVSLFALDFSLTARETDQPTIRLPLGESE
jgi:hypothetical protein